MRGALAVKKISEPQVNHGAVLRGPATGGLPNPRALTETRPLAWQTYGRPDAYRLELGLVSVAYPNVRVAPVSRRYPQP